MVKSRRVVQASVLAVLSVLVAGLVWNGSTGVAYAAKKGYHVTRGPVFNSAVGPNSAKFAINNHIKAAIRHSPRGSTIRIMSWNIHSSAMTDLLLRAQRRGVRVRVLMDATNWSKEVPNRNFKRLKAGLAKGNKGRKPSRRSAAKVCHGSCRGKSGSAHSKFFLFSWSGKSPRVVMEGSANITLAAATNQWNDLFTWVNNRKLYNFAVTVFAQMWRDKRVANPWTYTSSPPFTLAFSPEQGKRYSGDPMMNALNRTKCKGAKNGNASHHTVVRLFPDVMRGKRGLAMAKRVKALWNRGCDVRVGYTVLSYQAHAVLTSGGKRGRVPLRHMAKDTNGDGQFDKYFHIKALAINGVIGSNRSAFRLVQGSANASGLSAISDENIGIITKTRAVRRYIQHLTYWFNHSGRVGRPVVGTAGRTTLGDDATIARLRTPQGTRAAASDGYIAPGTKVIDPKTGKVVDPYALIDMD
ncbi:phospholipase D-like domain-containing protein [Nocardioides cheoyonin]|uniref:phospholipase D-like domain-containing protein n=1 Tax=Nocardioides cheoyonin TaxID=3156615 RepID=UPI0032B31BDF